jgi:hypothetical protein
MAAALLAGIVATSGCDHAHAVKATPRMMVETYVGTVGQAETDDRIPHLKAYGNELAALLDQRLETPQEVEQASIVLLDMSTCLTIAYGWKAHAHVTALQKMLADTPARQRRLMTILGHPTGSRLMQDQRCSA